MKNFTNYESNVSGLTRVCLGFVSGLSRFSLGEVAEKCSRYAAMIAILLTFSCVQAWGTAYTPSSDEVIILSEVHNSSATGTGYSDHSAIAWAGTASTTDKTAGDPSNEGAATSSAVGCYSIKGNGGAKNITVSITGCAQIVIYHESHSSRYVRLHDTDKDGTVIGSGEKSTYYTVVDLTPATSYTLFLEGWDDSKQQDLYVYAVELIKTSSGTGTGTISWAITTNTQTLTPTITGAGKSRLSNASTSISLTGLSTTSSSKDGYCKPFYGTVVDCPAADDYASISFKVASGYTFTPSSLSLTCFSYNSGDFKYKAVISDATYTITSNVLQPSSGGEGAITFASGAFTGKALTGTVTIKLFAYGLANTGSGTRTYIKSPVTISGTVAAEAPSSDCSAYEFHYGTHGEDDWETACFEQVGETNEWKIEDFTIPSTPNYYVGYHGDGEGGWNSTWSSERAWTDWPTKSDSKWQGQIFLAPNDGALGSFAVGLATGATGTLTIHSDYNDYNKYLSFTPDGYGITYGGSGHAFTETATSNMYETDVVTLPDVSSTTYTMGFQTATAGTYVTGIHSSAAENINAMGVTILDGGYKKILFNPVKNSDDYTTASAKIAIWDATNSAFYDFMTDTDDDGILEGYVPSTCTSISIVRLNSDIDKSTLTNSASTYSAAWAKKWNQSTDISVGDLLKQYNFNGWCSGDNCKETFTSTSISPATSDKGKFRMWANSASSNWYVHWIPYYVLTYDANGGTGTTAQTERNSESSTLTVSVAANGFTAPTGYSFNGWNTLAGGGGDSYAAGADYTLTANATLYAQWSANTISVTLAKGEHGAANQAMTIKYDAGSYLTFTAVSANTGYTCSGYYDGETKVLNADGSFAGSSVSGYITSSKWSKADDCTLTAKWQAKTYTVTLDANTSNHGSTGSSVTATYAAVLPAFDAAVGTAGYQVEGYYTTASGEGTKIINANGTLVRNTTYATDEGTPKWKYDGTVTLYARYELMEACYTLTPSTSGTAPTTRDVISGSGSGGIMEVLDGTFSYSSYGLQFQSSPDSKVSVAMENNMKAGTVIMVTLVRLSDTKARGLYIYDKGGSNKDATLGWSDAAADKAEATYTYTVTGSDHLHGTNGFQLWRKNDIALKSIRVMNCDDAATKYDLDFSFSNISLDEGTDEGDGVLIPGGNYTATFAASSGHHLPTSVTVTRGSSSTDITTNCTWDSSTGKLVIPGAQVTDDITISITGEADCSDPTSPTNGAIGSATAAVSWTAGGSEEAWEVYISEASTDPAVDETPTATPTSASYTFTSLTAETTYYWWVRAKCSASDKSAWVAGASFTTDCTAPSAPSTLSVTSYTHNSVTVSVTDAGDANNYDFYCTTSSTAPTSGTTPSASNTSKTPTITGLTASTTYYIYVRSKCSSTSFSSWVYAGSTFTTSASPTLSALVAGTLYKVADMVPEGTTITGDDQFVDGLSENTKFFLVGTGSGESGTTMKVKSDAQTIDAISFPNTYYFGTAATVSSNTPTNYAIKFMIPTGGGALKVYAKGSSAIKLSKEGVAGTAIGSGGTSVYGSYTLGVTAGTWYLYATGGSTAIYGVQLLVMHDLTTTVSGGVGGIVSAASSVAEGGTATVTATPAKGYVVTNWAVSGTGASITPSGASSSATTTLTMGTTDATVTVTFGKANYNVTYDDNGSTGGSEPTDATDYHYGDKVTVSDNTGTLVKTGYTFRGWTSGDYFYKAGDKFTITGNTTLKAVWENNSGSEEIVLTHFGTQYRTSAPRRGYAYVGSTSGTKYIIESDKSDNKNIDSDSSAIRINYNSYIKVLGPNATTTLSDSLFAGVSAISFDWKFHNSSSEYTTTVDVYVGGTKVASGVSLTGTNKSDYQTKEITVSPAKNGAVQIKNVSPSGSTNYSLYIDNISITSATPNFDVSFANMSDFGGTATLPSTIEGVPTGKKILKPTDPTTTGDYVFGGWYKEASCTNAWNFESDKVTGDVTLYAKWYDAAYTVTWKVNGADYATTKACGDVPIVLPAAPADNTLDDCANSFRGWSETNLYGEANDDQPSDLFIDQADAPTIGANKTYYAIFGTATDAVYKGTVLWSEDWTGADNNSTPTTLTSGGYAAVGAVIGYTWVDGTGSSSGTSKVATSSIDAGGVSPEAFIGKKGSGDGAAGGYLTISGIPRGNAKKVTVEYKANANRLVVSVSGTGYSGSNSTNTKDTHSFDVTCGTDETFSLTFTATTTSNVRLDDIVVKVKEDGATDYRCICPSLTVTPELITASTPIFITSAASKTVRSQDSLLIVGSGLDKSATLTLKSPSSKFALKTRTNEALTTDATGAISAVGYIFYTPDAGDTSDDLDKYSTFTVTDGSNDAIVDQALIGRHLPEDFVIVAKNGDKWYALPADMSSESNPTPAEIAVDDKDNPTVAYSANTNIYNLYGQNSGAGYLEEAGQYIKLGMKNNSNYPLYGYSGSKTSIKGDPGATVTNNIGKDYWWLFTQTNTSVTNSEDARYTIANASNEKTLSAWFTAAGGPKWGLYAAGNGEHTLRILPVNSTVGFAEAEIVAWGKNSAIVEVDNSTMIADYAIAKLPEDIESPHVTLSQTRTSVKNTGTRYNYTMNFGEGVDFSANGGKMLTLEWYDILNNLKAISNIMVPCIVAEDITINKSNYGTKSDWNKEVHVLPGTTVTVDASAYSSSNITIKKLVIYPGAKVIAENGTLITPTLVLRNGWNRLTAKTEYNIAQLYITPTTGNLQATNAYADWYIDYDQYYPIAVPWKVATANISYRNMTVDIDQGLIVRYYNGSRHAGVSVDGTSNWTTYTWGGGGTMPTYLEPGIGYAITARRPAGKAFSIIRMPLSIPSNDWTTAGEQGYVSETHKDEVAVTAWAKDDGTTPDHAKGWNFVANPYMASYEGEIAFTPDSDPGEDYEDEIAYVNIPDVNFKEFDQVDAATAELKPGSGVLIQTKYDGKITFATGSRKADAPAYRTTTPRAQKQKAYIRLSGEEAVDQMGLIIADRYTADYELNADLEKLLSDGNTLRTYMQYGNLNMAYVAINEDLAREWIPVTVRIPATGEYTFSLHEASKVSELEGIYLIDYESNTVTNLIEDNYSFVAAGGTIADRFAINAIVGKHDTPTDIDIINAGGDIHSDKPVKFIYRDKVYILNRGVIYDSTGKKVREINK